MSLALANFESRRTRTKQYLFPCSVDECVRMLAEHKGKARIVAGGTDLVIWMKEGKIAQKTLVDISRIKEIQGIDLRQDEIVLGAGLTHATVAVNKEIKQYFPALVEGCRSVGSPQIRHIATLGGNIVSAQPAADSVIPMTALDARCEIVSESGSRIVPMCQLYAGVGKSNVDSSCEIISKIFIPIPDKPYACAFTRAASREAMALPIVNAAVCVMMEGGLICCARIAIAPVAITPFRAGSAEAFLVGKDPLDKKILAEAARIASAEAKPRDSLQRGSGEYRKVLVGDLVEKALIKVSSDIKGVR